MKIGIVGGGPAGLYFALLMKKQDPRHHVRVVERNPAAATYGWGVVFSDRALSFLESGDPESYQALARRPARSGVLTQSPRGRTATTPAVLPLGNAAAGDYRGRDGAADARVDAGDRAAP